jgi:MraZ protein
MFSGSHQLTVDDKGRLAIPTRMRQQLAEEHGLQVFITRGPQTSIEIYPPTVFRAIAEQIQGLEDRRAADMLKEVFVGHAVETEIDKQGRVLLPQVLRAHAHIDTAARLVGQVNRLDVWAEHVWAERHGESKTAVLVDAFTQLKLR